MVTEHTHSVETCAPRICSKCETLKWGCEFKRKNQSRCKPCINVESQEYRARRRERDPDFKSKPLTAEQNLQSVCNQRGITVDDYWRMMKEQDGKCAICKEYVLVANQTRLHIDHNHATKKVRGLLCFHCNNLLGMAKDSPSRLLTAAQYLLERDGDSN